MFSALRVLACSASGGRSGRACCARLPTRCGGTTPVWRCPQHCRAECRAAGRGCAAPAPCCRPLRPSSAQGWRRMGRAPVRRRRGGGAAHRRRRRSTAVSTRARARVPATRGAPGGGGRGGLPRAQTPPGAAARPSGAGGARQGRGRRRAHLLGALRGGGPAPERQLLGACACQRPPGRGWAPGDCGRCLWQAVSPPGPEPLAQARARAGRGGPLQHRPLCGARGPSGAQTCPTGSLRLLAPTCCGDTMPRPPAPGGRGRSGAWRRASRGAGGGHGPGRAVPRTGAGPRGAGPCCGERGRGRCASGQQRCSTRGRSPGAGGQPGRHTARRRLPAGRGPRSAGRARAGGTGGWYVGPARQVPRGCAAGACGVGAARGWRAAPRERPRRGGAGRRAAGAPSVGQRSSRFGPARHAALS
jgi:hypothetical protein